MNNVLALLTPLAYDPAHPFPFLSNLSTSLGVTLRNAESGERGFASRLHPRDRNQAGPYDHLARVAEWARGGAGLETQ